MTLYRRALHEWSWFHIDIKVKCDKSDKKFFPVAIFGATSRYKRIQKGVGPLITQNTIKKDSQNHL